MSRTPPPDFFDETLRRLDSGAPAISPTPPDTSFNLVDALRSKGIP